MRHLFTVIFLLLFVSTAGARDVSPADATAELNALNDKFNEYVATRNVEKFIDLYAEDALWIEPGKPPVAGREPMRGLIKFIGSKDGQMSHSVDKLFISDDGNQATMIGSADINVPKVGFVTTGTYLFVLQRIDGQWKIVTDMWHQHTPETKEG